MRIRDSIIEEAKAKVKQGKCCKMFLSGGMIGMKLFSMSDLRWKNHLIKGVNFIFLIWEIG